MAHAGTVASDWTQVLPELRGANLALHGQSGHLVLVRYNTGMEAPVVVAKYQVPALKTWGSYFLTVEGSKEVAAVGQTNPNLARLLFDTAKVDHVAPDEALSDLAVLYLAIADHYGEEVLLGPSKTA